jgi:hypothetical protein
MDVPKGTVPKKAILVQRGGGLASGLGRLLCCAPRSVPGEGECADDVFLAVQTQEQAVSRL